MNVSYSAKKLFKSVFCVTPDGVTTGSLKNRCSGLSRKRVNGQSKDACVVVVLFSKPLSKKLQ